MDIDGLHLLIGYLREDFKSFKNNDFHELKGKVDKLSVRIAWIMGGFTVVNGLIWVLVKVLG